MDLWCCLLLLMKQNCLLKTCKKLNLDDTGLFLPAFPSRTYLELHNIHVTPKLVKKIFFFIGIHSMQGGADTTRHGVTTKRSTKRLKHTGNLFRKNLQLKDVC